MCDEVTDSEYSNDLGDDMTTAIWWIGRDLRLSDNQALTKALAYANQVIPVLIFDPVLLNSSYVGSKRLAFLLESLRRLEGDLQA
jgi:deoxyribodipyrimidine photo-lyase